VNFIRKFIGNKAFYKELLVVALPIALQQLVSALVNALDTLMVSGWNGSTATAAVSIANRYFNSFNSIMVAIAVSCSVFIAQFYGAKRKDKLKEMFGINIILVLSFALIAFSLGFFFSSNIVDMFIGTVKQDNTIGINYRQYAIDYLTIVVFSFIPLAFTNAFTFTFRPLKMTTVPLISAIAAALTNTFFNYCMIYGKLGFAENGVKGAAIATVISRFVELTILIVYFYIKKPEFHGKLKEIFAIPRNLIGEVLKRARPLVLAQVLTEGMLIFTLFVYARIDEGNPTNVAAIAVTQQMVDIVITFTGGMGTAASILVGSRLGAGKIEEAKTNARWQLGYVFIFSLIAALTLMALIPAASFLFGFKQSEIGLLTTIMIIQAVSLPFQIYAINVIFISRSGGYTRAPIYITNVVYYCVKLPVILAFVYIFPTVFDKLDFLHSILTGLGLEASLVVFIFLLDRFTEVIRTFVAYFIYTRVNWWNNINTTV
jgi:putative MATE family efflux protein